MVRSLRRAIPAASSDVHRVGANDRFDDEVGDQRIRVKEGLYCNSRIGTLIDEFGGNDGDAMIGKVGGKLYYDFFKQMTRFDYKQFGVSPPRHFRSI